METMDVTAGDSPPLAPPVTAVTAVLADSIPVRETGFFGYERVGLIVPGYAVALPASAMA